jgi:hypothetical protein
MKRMKILWIPHGTWERKVRQRDQYFIDKLKENHEIHVITWTEPKGPKLRYFLNPLVHLKALRNWTKTKKDIHLHHFRRLCLSRFSVFRDINEKFFQRKIKEIVHRYGIEVVICGPNYYLNGFPPFNLHIPLIFDYVDYGSKESISKTYLENSRVVLCASKVLYEKAKKYNPYSYYLPNGVDIEKFENTHPEKVRSTYGLKGKMVVSLIGLTCSESFYFLEAFPIIKEKVPELKFLIVGDGYFLPEMKKKAKKFRDDIIFTGWINYDEIQDYFAASDVGMYPVDQTAYFDSACPIKIFEYTAAKKPVVSTDLKELHNLNFSNVIFCTPGSKDFSEKVVKALNTKFDYPDLKEYDWDLLARKLEGILASVIKEKQ